MVKERCGPSILVADEDVTTRLLLQQVLQEEGYSVSHCGESSLALTRALGPSFSLLILDADRPGMEVVRTLRSAGNSVPVILMAGEMHQDDPSQWEKFDRVTCLYKPFFLSNIESCVETFADACGLEIPVSDEANVNRLGSGDRGERERRRFDRFRVDHAASAKLRRMGFQTLFGVRRESGPCAALELSEGGVRLQSQERLSRGSHMRVKLSMDDSTDAFEAAGEVAWCDGGDGKEYEAGIRFTDSDDSRTSLISQLRDILSVGS